MASFDIAPSSLISRQEKASVGERIIKAMQSPTQDENGGIIGWLWNAGSRLVGFLVSKAGDLFKITLSAIWGLITSALAYIWNFNWNATDEQMNSSIQQQWNSIAGQLGGTVGNALGYIGCGFIPAASVFVFNEPLGAYLLKKVGEEFADELLGNLGALCRSVTNLAVRTLITSYFINARKFIKSNTGILKKIFPDKANIIDTISKAWGTKDSKPWSFAIAVENAIESIPNEFLRNFVEEAVEEAWDGCVEVGYVISDGITRYYANAAIDADKYPPLGENLTVEIQLNRKDDKADKIILQAPEAILRGQILDTLVADQQMRGKNIGTLYGTPPQTTIKDKAFRPHVFFYFQQLKEDVPSGNLLDAELSLRLMNQTSQTISSNDVLLLATKVKAKLATPPFRIAKGNKPYTYGDATSALQTTLWVDSLVEAKRVVESLLDIVGESPNWKKLKYIGPAEGEVSLIPDRIVVLGETEKFPVKGKPGVVQFQESYLLLYGKDDPISLIDLSGKRSGSIVSV